MYIYIYREREREKTKKKTYTYIYIHTYVCMYVYVHILEIDGVRVILLAAGTSKVAWCDFLGGIRKGLFARRLDCGQEILKQLV